jgi:Concanavalin A-like lectin/glucanases superfamily
MLIKVTGKSKVEQGAFFGGPKSQKTPLTTLTTLATLLLFLGFSNVYALATKSTTPSSLPSNGLVLHHTFDGKKMTSSTSTDSSARGNNGDLMGTPRPAIGKLGQALSFNGSSQYITTNNSSDFNFSDQVSISMWLKPGSTQGAYADILSKFTFMLEQDSTSTNSYYFNWTDGIESSGCAPSPIFTLTANIWQHVLVVKSGTLVKGYVNGVETGSCTGSFSSIASNSDILTIGRSSSFGSQYWSGSMDDLRIYNRALTAKEMTALAGTKITNKSTILTRPISHYTFDEVSGDAIDSGSAKINLSMPTTSRTKGKLGRGLSTTAYPDYPPVATTSLTVTGWFFFKAGGEHADLGLYQPSEGNGSYQFRLGSFACGEACEDTMLGFSRMPVDSNPYQYGASTTVASFVSSASFINRWHHLAGTYSSSGWEFYLDGTLLSTSSDTGMPQVISPRLHFLDASPLKPVDEVRIYDKKLTASEILNIYNTTKSSVSSYGTLGTSTNSLPVSNGLVAYYSFDGKTISTTGATTTTQDVIGGNNASFTNMSTTTSRVLGKVGQAITFDGGDDKLTVSTATALAPKPLSVSFWAKSNRPVSTYYGPIGMTTIESWTEGWGFYTPGSSEMRFFVEGYSTNYAAFTNLNPQVWHHYVGVWDGNNIYLYVDGVRGSVTDTYSGAISITNPLYIGSVDGQSSYDWQGPVDEVRIYNRALSPKEIITLYKMGSN